MKVCEGVVMENQPTPVIGLDPKGNGLRVRRPHARLPSTHRRPGVKHPPTATPNGHTEQGNPPGALTGGRSGEQETIRMSPLGKMAQEAKAWGNAQDTLTWARTMGR